MEELERIRKLIRITREWIYLDNAGAGPLPEPTVESVRNYLERWAVSGEPWEEGLRTVERVKTEFSHILKGPSEDAFAAVVNATTALNKVLLPLVVDSIRKGVRGNIIIDNSGFPTGFQTPVQLKKRGLLGEVRLLKKLHAEDKLRELEELIDRNTLAVVVDHVSWKTGVRVNLAEMAGIAEDRGALLVTDAFHSVGSVRVELPREKPDVLYFGSYKWLMAPHGAGLLYLSRRAMERLDPLCIGWFSVKDSVVERLLGGRPLFESELPGIDYSLSDTARRFEDGTLPLHAFMGLAASLRFIGGFGWDSVYQRVASLSRILREILGEHVIQLEEREESGIVIANTDRSAEVARKLENRYRIKISSRPGFLRISPHFYNTVEDVEKAGWVIRKVMERTV